MLSTLYIDLDDTVKDTDKYIKRYLECNGVHIPQHGYSYDYVLGDLNESFLREVLNNWDIVPFKEAALSGISLLKTEYTIIFVSGVTTRRESVEKRKFAKSMDCGIILCSGDNWDKSHIDMHDGIMIDDRPKLLLKSNAAVKYEMYNEYTFDINAERDSKTKVVDWYSLIEYLMPEERPERSTDLISKYTCLLGQGAGI